MGMTRSELVCGDMYVCLRDSVVCFYMLAGVYIGYLWLYRWYYVCLPYDAWLQLNRKGALKSKVGSVLGSENVRLVFKGKTLSDEDPIYVSLAPLLGGGNNSYVLAYSKRSSSKDIRNKIKQKQHKKKTTFARKSSKNNLTNTAQTALNPQSQSKQPADENVAMMEDNKPEPESERETKPKPEAKLEEKDTRSQKDKELDHLMSLVALEISADASYGDSSSSSSSNKNSARILRPISKLFESKVLPESAKIT